MVDRIFDHLRIDMVMNFPVVPMRFVDIYEQLEFKDRWQDGSMAIL